MSAAILAVLEYFIASGLWSILVGLIGERRLWTPNKIDRWAVMGFQLIVTWCICFALIGVSWD